MLPKARKQYWKKGSPSLWEWLNNLQGDLEESWNRSRENSELLDAHIQRISKLEKVIADSKAVFEVREEASERKILILFKKIEQNNQKLVSFHENRDNTIQKAPKNHHKISIISDTQFKTLKAMRYLSYFKFISKSFKRIRLPEMRDNMSSQRKL